MNSALPPTRKLPVVPRPREGELSGSYLARIAQANRTDLHTFAGLLGCLVPRLPAKGLDLAVAVLTLNDAAFARLLAYTGLAADHLIRAIPSLAPRTYNSPDEPPAVRVSFLQAPAADCPLCRLRRDGAHLDTRVFPHKTACLHHGYWLYGQGRGQRLDFGLVHEVAVAQQRLNRLTSRFGGTAAMRAYRIAAGYLESEWRLGHRPSWYPAMITRWQQRTRAGGYPAAQDTWQLPGWAVHPECTALAAIFANPHWARLAVPQPGGRHRIFYARLLTELAIEDTGVLKTVRNFAPLPGDIQEQARWGRLLNDPEWGSPPPVSAAPCKIPFIDISDDYEKSVSRRRRKLWIRSASLSSPTSGSTG